MSTKEAPLVSICLPVYNGARTIVAALDSLLAQTWPNLEIIICDDISSDETSTICQKYARKYPFIYFEVNDRNLGLSGLNNFKKTLSMAKGKYSVWASQDDLWHKDFVSKLTERLEKNPHAVAAMGGVKHFVLNDGKEWALESRLSKENWPQNNSDITNYFNLFFQEGHSQQLRRNINPEMTMSLYIHGVVRTNFFKETIQSLSQNIGNIRPVVSLWPLLGKMIYVDDLLFYKEEMTSFLSPKNQIVEAEKYLDAGLLEEFKKRQSKKKADTHQNYSKIKFTWSIMTSHLTHREIPLYYKWAPVLLFVFYILRLKSNPIRKLFRKKPLNNKYNLLKTPPEKLKNLAPKSPLP